MNLELSKFTWHNKDNIWVTGFLRKGERYMTGYSLVEYFLISSLSEFEVILKAANGQFSVIIRSGTDIWAATDRLRNYPIFYMFHDGKYILSDDCYKLTRIQNEYKLCKEAFDCFLSNGFVLNNLTLADKIFQIEAGELVDLGEIITRKFYFDINKFNKNLYDFVLKEHVFSKYNLNLKNELNPLPSQKALQSVKERIKELLPYRIREWFISHESVILYDEITRLMIDEIDPSNLIIPKQSNYYNSYITQWYLLKTRKFLNR